MFTLNSFLDIPPQLKYIHPIICPLSKTMCINIAHKTTAEFKRKEKTFLSSSVKFGHGLNIGLTPYCQTFKALMYV